ncbi:MAG: hypothetical protein ACYTHK_00250 [Planctomycetota bacterium]|jgi:hypothetical protein
MRGTIGVACLLLLGLSLGVAFSQDETKTAEPEEKKDPTLREPVAVDRMWSFHWEGSKEKGSFLELARPDAEKKGEGRTLVITHLEVRQRQTMNWRFVEHRKEGRGWKKITRRSHLFSLGWLDGTSKYMVSGYSSLVGMKFGPKSRPSIEVRQGSGDMAVYAEGYWAD